ncbi:MAG: ABC transporter permease [bacterium]
MSLVGLWRQLTRGLSVLANRRAAELDVHDEVQDYLERSVAAHVARGVSPTNARRAAQIELGNTTVTREHVRAYGWENLIGTLLTDLRYAARRLRSSPGFAAVSVITLALGIGASTAIFSAVNPILFEPLPYPDPSRITMVSDIASDGGPMAVTFGTYREIVQRSRSFAHAAAFGAWQPTMIGDAEPERLTGQRVTADYFRVLGVRPILGRDMQASDDRVDGPKVAVVSDALWRRRLGADPTAVGRNIKLDDDAYLIIGVMPGNFENVTAPRAELWTPLQYRTVFGPDTREWGHHLRMVARTRPDVSLAQAVREMAAIARAPRPDFVRVPWASLKDGLLVTALKDDVTGAVRPALLAVLGAVLLVLAIACVNVTNLLLARGAQRRGEFAMRAALGAGRTRLLRQLITESVFLALIGGAIGMVVAEIGVRGLAALSPPELPRVGIIRVDGAVFAFGLIVTTLVGVIVGVIPALHAAREDLRAGLQHGSRRAAGGQQMSRRVLVVVEVAMALMLLVSAGLLMRSLERLFAVDIGFDSSRLLTMQVQVTGHRYGRDDVRYRFMTEALDAVRRVPGVMSAAFTSQLPLSGDLDIYGVHFERDGNPKDDGAALRYAVTPDYFAATRIPLLRGRVFDSHDVAGAPRVVLINESFAKRKFAGRDPIGQRMRFGPDEGEWYTVVGVVGDVRQASLDVDQPDAVYVPPSQWHWVDAVASLVVRARVDAVSLAPAIRAAIWSVDKDQAIVRVATMEQLATRAAANRRFALILFEAFGAVALVLAATGIYGVLSGGVAERMREIGVRSAMGARPRDILTLVLRQGMTLAVLGVALGIAGAVAASRALVSLLFGISRLDPITYAGVVVLLLGVSAVACWIPAWRAASVDPSITLRAD